MDRDEGCVDEEHKEGFYQPTCLGTSDYGSSRQGILLRMCDGNIYEISVRKISDATYKKMLTNRTVDPNGSY